MIEAFHTASSLVPRPIVAHPGKRWGGLAFDFLLNLTWHGIQEWRTVVHAPALNDEDRGTLNVANALIFGFPAVVVLLQPSITEETQASGDTESRWQQSRRCHG